MEEEFDTTENEEVNAGEQQKIKKNKRGAHLGPWMYKKGQSGNPKGRPEGISLKEYARKNFRHMTEEEREEFFHGMDKKVLWEMAEGKPDTKTDITSAGEKMQGVVVLPAKEE